MLRTSMTEPKYPTPATVRRQRTVRTGDRFGGSSVLM